MEKQTHIYGIRAVIAAIETKETIDKVFIQKGLKGELIKTLETLIRKQGLNASYVPAEKLDRLAKQQQNHQGVVASISPIQFYELDPFVEAILAKKEAPLFLLLDQLSDVRNFGAIIRTASCTGVDGIIIQKKGTAPVTADTIKTSAGAAFQVPIIKVNHLKDAVFHLQASAVNVVAATEKAQRELYEVSFTGPTAIVMGAEDVGITPSILKAVNAQAKLPMQGSIGSLNVSVACGVFLYETVRQRKFPK